MSSTGWFELSKNAHGQFRFVLKSGNAETILMSQEYGSRRAAEEGIEAVRKSAHGDAHYERKAATNGRPYFDLRSANHEVIGTSQLYADVATCEEGIAAVKAHGATHAVKDRSERPHEAHREHAPDEHPHDEHHPAAKGHAAKPQTVQKPAAKHHG